MKTAIVIGAGPAGLTAAYELRRRSKDWKIIVLEGSAEIGGLSRTVFHDGCRIDIGGHRFFSKSQQVNDIWNQIMPMQGKPAKDDIILDRACHLSPNGPDPEKEDTVMLCRHRVSRIYYLRHFFDYPITVRPMLMGAFFNFTPTDKGVVASNAVHLTWNNIINAVYDVYLWNAANQRPTKPVAEGISELSYLSQNFCQNDKS